ncbi:MAG: hypothetical protein ACK6CU_09830 [Deltaproteobacteria bacterium]|jgi:hypothetical protein
MSLRSLGSNGRVASAQIIALFALLTSGCEPPRAARGRSSPVCATQDCATGRILDDGCSDDGRCASCIHPCPRAPAPPEASR